MNENVDNLSKNECIVKKDAYNVDCCELLEDTEWFKNMSTEMTAGKAIRADRGLRGWTQKVLAEKLGISIQNLSAMEHDRRPVSKKMAKKLSQVFGVSPESYFKF
ncbi:MAG: helix-turn-helix domain-containing protein [Fibrobacter sp.]|nr:helix-turn-helix domain-containing protein [Fibrobacter sp.]